MLVFFGGIFKELQKEKCRKIWKIANKINGKAKTKRTFQYQRKAEKKQKVKTKRKEMKSQQKRRHKRPTNKYFQGHYNAHDVHPPLII